MGDLSVYVEGGDANLKSMFSEHGYSLTTNPIEASIIVLQGGADVSPELYGEENTHSHTHVPNDIHTFGLLGIAAHLGIPVVGICRGHQALAVWHHMRLNQHVEGHGYDKHVVYGPEGAYEVLGDHHQSVRVEDIVGNLSVSESGLSADGVSEYILYKDGDMGFQGHPEWDTKDSDTRKLFFHLLETHTLKFIGEY